MRLSAVVVSGKLLDSPFSSAASLTPVIWDRPSTDPKASIHAYRGRRRGYVLFLDGHVEFKKYGEFPISEKFARLLEERRRAKTEGFE